MKSEKLYPVLFIGGPEHLKVHQLSESGLKRGVIYVAPYGEPGARSVYVLERLGVRVNKVYPNVVHEARVAVLDSSEVPDVARIVSWWEEAKESTLVT
jgi:hypothetical protein